jgi:uncharacterized protein (DUF302 family)
VLPGGEKPGQQNEKRAEMATKNISVQRFSVTSSKSFHDVVAAFETAIGHPEMNALRRNIAAAKTFAEVEKIIHGATGPSDLMEFTRMDLGEVLRKRNGAAARRSLRFVVGNPVIMSQMVQHVPDAGSYAPVTILIDERPDGVHLSYDRMASFLAPYENSEALNVARELDTKVETLLTAVAGNK